MFLLLFIFITSRLSHANFHRNSKFLVASQLFPAFVEHTSDNLVFYQLVGKLHVVNGIRDLFTQARAPSSVRLHKATSSVVRGSKAARAQR